MSATVWITVGGLAVTTALIKAVGPVIFGGRELHPALQRVILLLPAALLAALVVTETVSGHARTVTIDARAAGGAAACIALIARAQLLVVVLAAAITTAVLRAVG
jgi:branched-subunit amino acid transport protein